MPIPLALAGIAGAKIGGDILGGYLGNRASRRAQGQQEGALDRAGQISQQRYGAAIGGFQPFQQGGTQAFGTLADLAQGPGITAPTFDPGPAFSQQTVLDDPGYQFRLGEGLKSVNQSAAARGGALGGDALRELQSRGEGLASSELGQAYNRFSNERQFRYGGQQDEFRNQLAARQQQFGQLQNVAGFGERAAGNVGRYQSRLGDILGGQEIQRGNIQAAGTMGRNRNFRNMLSGGINNLTDLAGGFFGGGGGLPGGGGQFPQGAYPGMDVGVG